MVGALLFVNLVSLSTTSSKPRLRRISWVTGGCCSVNRKLVTTISGRRFFIRTWLVFVELSCVVSWCRVVAVEDQLCMRGLGCHLF